MDAHELLLSIIDIRWNKYRAELKACRAEFSPEAVHDLRVATRRLLAVLDLLRALAPHPRIQKLRRELKDQLDGFDDLRDTQMALADVAEVFESLPELEPFEEYLLKLEKRLLREAKKQIKEIKTGNLEKRIEKVQKNLSSTLEASLASRILGAVDDTYLMAAQLFAGLDPSRPASIHHLRIAFKKLRYLVEYIHPVIPGFPESNLKRMHDYQAMMGEIQDMEVLMQLLEEFIEQKPDVDLAAARRSYEQRHSEAIIRYIEDKGELITFWRIAPEKNFPWESTNESVSN